MLRLDIRLVADKRQLDALRGIAGAIPRALAATAEDVEALVMDGAGRHAKPGGSGRLFASVIRQRDGDGWFIGHDKQIAPYAYYVHWGTRPHVIRPKNKKALRWPAGGKFRFAKKVHHPGYKGDPWLVRAAAQAGPIFAQQVDRLIAGSGSAQTMEA